VIGPWTHGGDAGELDYSNDPEALLMALVLPWFDHCLRGVSNEVESWPPVSVFLMGAVGEHGAPGNEWVELAASGARSSVVPEH
jgi:hypothetical protein